MKYQYARVKDNFRIYPNHESHPKLKPILIRKGEVYEIIGQMYNYEKIKIITSAGESWIERKFFTLIKSKEIKNES